MGKISVPVTTPLVSKERHVRDCPSIMQHPCRSDNSPSHPSPNCLTASTFLRKAHELRDFHCTLRPTDKTAGQTRQPGPARQTVRSTEQLSGHRPASPPHLSLFSPSAADQPRQFFF